MKYGYWLKVFKQMACFKAKMGNKSQTAEKVKLNYREECFHPECLSRAD